MIRFTKVMLLGLLATTVACKRRGGLVGHGRPAEHRRWRQRPRHRERSFGRRDRRRARDAHVARRVEVAWLDRHQESRNLQPGDVIITKDRAGQPGHPDHVYMFDGWDGSNPRAVDNQGFAHTRTAGRSPIAYGLRAPAGGGSGSCNQSDASAPQRDSCGGKGDGWYCSEQESYSAYECRSGDIIGGWQCGNNTVRRSNSGGQATLSGSSPGCFGAK